MNTNLKIKLLTELTALLGDRVSDNETVRNEHGGGFTYHENKPPDVVAYPLSTDEVVSIINCCSQLNVPIVPYGAGTSIEGHILAIHGGVCIDLQHMNEVLEVNQADMYATIQAGVTRNQLDNLLIDSGFFFPIGPGVNATLGGMASTRASGTNAVRYGTMKDNVLSMTVVLANGQVIKTGSKAKKSSAGYDLTRLFVGAEGTLGIITELTIKLHSYPEHIFVAICNFPSVEAAVNTAIKTIQKGIPIAKIELLDELMIKAVNQFSALNYPERPTLFLEFHGSVAELEEQISKVQQIAAELGASDFEWEKDKAKQQILWRARTDAAPAAVALVPNGKLMSTDVCVPISRLATCITQTQDDIKASGLIAPVLGHVGDGNFHLAIVIKPDDLEELAKAKKLNERLVMRALAMDGTCTGEHGIGTGKLPFMPLEHHEALDVMRAIKQALDPANLMNPGKLIV